MQTGSHVPPIPPVPPTPKSSMKVNRSIGGATSVSANCYAIVDYLISPGASSYSGAWGGAGSPGIVQRIFGPGQSIPASFNFTIGLSTGITATYSASIQSGVEFINT